MAMNSKSGKCSNFGNCSIADARTTVEVPGGLDFVCSECGKPLLLNDTQGGGGSKVLLVVGLLLAALLVAGGAAWFFLAGKPIPPPAVIAPSPPAPQTEAPARPVNGHCSPADERVGLCRTTP